MTFSILVLHHLQLSSHSTAISTSKLDLPCDGSWYSLSRNSPAFAYYGIVLTLYFF